MEKIARSGVKFPLRPTGDQAQALARWAGCQRAVYNAKVQEDEYFWGFKRKAVALAGERAPVDAMYAQFKDKELTPWLYEVPSQILRNGASRWHDAKWRAIKGECGQPSRKGRGGKQSVLLTPDLFELVPLAPGQCAPKGSCNRHRLRIGTKARNLGFVEFFAHREYRAPKQITVSRDADGWHASFNFEAQAEDWEKPQAERPWWAQAAAPEGLRSPQELLYELSLLGEAELAAKTLGIDRGVANPMSDSRGAFLRIDPVCLERVRRKEKGIKKQQKRLARQQRGSANSRKTKRKIARKHAYGRHVRKDFTEKATTAIARDNSIQIVAIEALNVAGMTRAPAPKPGKKPGRWLRNGAAAKAGLNRAILASCWGLAEIRLGHKLAARNKVLVAVRAAYSSQECSACGHTHADNRPKQAAFRCAACGHEEHADANAPKVIRKRAVADILSGAARDRALERDASARPTKAAKREKASEEAGQTGPGRPDVPVEPLEGSAPRGDASPTGAAKQEKKAGLAPAGSPVL